MAMQRMMTPELIAACKAKVEAAMGRARIRQAERQIEQQAQMRIGRLD
jgi:hypothetical protein